MFFFFTGSADSYPSHSLPGAAGAAARAGRALSSRESLVVAPACPARLAFLAHAGHPAEGELNLFTTRKETTRCKAVNGKCFKGFFKLIFFGNSKVLSWLCPLKISQNTWKEEQKQDQSHDQRRSESPSLKVGIKDLTFFADSPRPSRASKLVRDSLCPSAFSK